MEIFWNTIKLCCVSSKICIIWTVQSPAFRIVKIASMHYKAIIDGTRYLSFSILQLLFVAVVEEGTPLPVAASGVRRSGAEEGQQQLGEE